MFPAGLAGNVFRGAFGQLASAELFRPRLTEGPSGLKDPPRPYVFRAAHLDGQRFEPGQKFFVDVNLFDLRESVRESFVTAFSELSRTGLGPLCGRVELAPPVPPHVVAVDLTEVIPATSCTVVFRTPTDLKGGAEALFARVRDRISTLCELYGEGTPDIDFKGMSERAARIRITGSDLDFSEVSRRSSRTGDVHGIGGFTGSVSYEGDLTEFVPYLRAAFWTGVGRHTAWGNGVIELVGRT